jgi:hypothetical protein
LNLTLIRPGSAVFDSEGEQIGTVTGVSGDRFHLRTRRSDFWIPYDWVLLAHGRTVLVNTTQSELGQFRDARPSRWLRSA